MQNDYDILIVGAGLIGASLALALSQTSLRIALCEAGKERGAEGRAIALTYSSFDFLQKLNIKLPVTPIHTVHVSQRGHLGITKINAAEENVPALGYVVPIHILNTELNKAILSLQNVKIFNPATVNKLTKTNTSWQVELPNENFTATLVIAADGSHSSLRELQNIKTETRDYGQSALVTNVTLARSHQNIAYERFVEKSVIAMLPQEGLCSTLVWTAPHLQIEELLKLDDKTLLQKVQDNFGYRLGKLLSLGKRHCHPLKFIYAQEQIQPGFILLGNAAHTIHPVAAQGFNLGLSAVKCLAKLISEAKDLNDYSLLQEYARLSHEQQQKIIRFTDRLTTWFARDFLPINLARSGGLMMLDIISPLKHRLAKQLMGIN